MEATVRRIPTQIAVIDGEELATGAKPALCFRGKTYALGVVNDQESICTVTLSLRDYDKAPLVRYGTEPDSEYPVSRFISHMERISVDKPISDEAMFLLKQWPNLPADFGDEIIPDDDEEEKPPRPSRRLTRSKRQNCIRAVAIELKTTPQKIRKFLRSQGMRAPYDNEKEIRKLLRKYQ